MIFLFAALLLPLNISVQNFGVREVLKPAHEREIVTDADRPKRFKTVSAVAANIQREGLAVYVLLKNSGDKTIKSVEWEYTFYDPRTSKEMKRFSLHTDKSIAPYGMAFLEERIVRYGFLPSRPDYVKGTQTVRIRRIHYADGTHWSE